MPDLLTAPRGELLRLIYELIETNQILKTRITELESALHEKGGTSGKPPLPLFIKPNKKKRKKEERTERKENFARKLDIPTEKVFHAYEVCPDCGGLLGKPSVSYKRQVIDVVLPTVNIVEHVICKNWCFACQKRVSPKVDFSELVLGNRRVGLNLMSVIATLRERLRLPLNVIQLYLSAFYQLKLSEGELVAILDKLAAFSKDEYKVIKDQIITSDAVNADETGHREDGVNGYLWSFSTPSLQYLLYRKSRGSKIVAEVLGKDGENFNGVLVTDFYAAYNEHSGFHQRCWAHLFRDIHELKEKIKEENPKNRKVSFWAKKIKELYEEAKSYTGPPSKIPLGLQAQERIDKEAYFKEKIRKVCEPYLTNNTPMSLLCGRIIKFLPELFTFIRFPNVPSTNNLAERALRHSVVQRKISGGTRSSKGSETKAILGSLFGTWNLQGLNPLSQCRLLLTRDPCQ